MSAQAGGREPDPAAGDKAGQAAADPAAQAPANQKEAPGEQATQAAADRTTLTLAKGPLAGPVLCRVVSMVLTRADWPVDQLHDAMLVCDALSAHAPAYASNGRMTFALSCEGQQVELRVEDLAPEGAAGLVRDAELPGVGNVLERIPKRLETQPTGSGSRLILVLSPG